MTKSIIPYVQITVINDFIRNFPKERNCDLNDLHQFFGESKVSNLMPTLILLQFVDYNRKERKVELSEFGKKYRIALVTNSENDASKMLKTKVETIELMKFILSLLEVKKILSSEEIGKQIAYKYNKTWTNKKTYGLYGSAIASIIGFCKLGFYSRGVLRKEKEMNNETQKPALPSASFNSIFKVTKKIYDLKETDLDALTNDFGKRIGSTLTVCVELGLIERIAPKVYKITNKGDNLVDPFNDEEITKNWKGILLESKYWRYILYLQNKEIKTSTLGDFLNKHLGGHWKSQNTAITYSKKFMTWLKNASIVQKSGNGLYIVNLSQEEINGSEKKLGLEKKKKEIIFKDLRKETQIEKNIPINSLVKLTLNSNNTNTGLRIQSPIDPFSYKLGKEIGNLQMNLGEDSEHLSNIIKMVMDKCKEYDQFGDIYELFKDNLKLYQEIMDSRIFFPTIKLLEKKIGIQKQKGS